MNLDNWQTQLRKGLLDIVILNLLQHGRSHGYEMVQAAGVGLRFQFGKIPILSGAVRYAQEWIFPSGSLDNRVFFGSHVSFASQIDEASQMLLFDAQTSGGLLLSVPPDKLNPLLTRAKELGAELWEVGEVIEGDSIQVIV